MGPTKKNNTIVGTNLNWGAMDFLFPTPLYWRRHQAAPAPRFIAGHDCLLEILKGPQKGGRNCGAARNCLIWENFFFPYPHFGFILKAR